tara:strand:+ start:2818 stop:3093 length:276 start_codon:yes stop_codon:yes gene_type:complete
MDRLKYIIVFHDITNAPPDWDRLYKAYLPADNLLSAELMSKCVKGMVVGVVDDYNEEIYFEEGMEQTVREVARTKYVFNYDILKQNRKKDD